MTSLLSRSIAELIIESLSSSPDRLVRFHVDEAIPMIDALNQVFESINNIVVGILDPDSFLEFNDVDFIVETNPKIMTKLRNDLSSNSGKNSSFPSLVLIGERKGQDYDGLTSLTSLGLSELIERWKDLLNSDLSIKFQNEDLRIRKTVVSSVTTSAFNRNFTIEAANEFLQNTVYEPSPDMVQKKLWMLELIPDESLVQHSSFLSRMQFNSDLIDTLSRDYEENGTKYVKLNSSSNPKVKSFAKYLETGDEDDLKKSELTAILEALKTPVKPPSEKPLELIELLGVRNLENRHHALIETERFLTHSALKDSSIIFEGSDPKEFILKIIGNEKFVEQWQNSLAPSSSDHSDQLVSVLETINQENIRSDTPVTEFAYRNTLSNFIKSDFIDDYFNNRKQIIEISHLLTANSDEVLTLLVASKLVFEIANNYLNSWKNLLRNFSESSADDEDTKVNAGVWLGLLDGNWTRIIEGTDSVEQSGINKSLEFVSAKLAPFHPWKIEPLVKLANEILNKFENEPNVVSAASWAIDRAIPSFRVLQIARSSLKFASVNAGSIVFQESLQNSLPPITIPGQVLKRSYRAYKNSHPWSESGSTMAMINIPEGGVSSKLNRFVDETFLSSSAVIQIRDRKLIGLEYDDSDEVISVSQTVEEIESWFQENRITRDVTLFFVSDKIAQSIELGQGAHSTIEIILKNLGISPSSGKQLLIPQIKLAAEESDETVSLLRDVAAPDGSPSAATFDLTMSSESMSALQVLSDETAWLIVATPTFISAFNIVDTQNNELFQVAEFDEGLYRYFIYARSLQPLSEKVENLVKELPLGGDQLRGLQAIVNSLTSSLPQKAFEIASNRFGPEEALGLVNARAIAEKFLDSDNLTIEISLDNISWSQRWFSSDEKRADLLLISISPDLNSENPITLMVVEAKGVSSAFASPIETIEPFTKALSQVDSTRSLLIELFAQADEQLIESLQLRTLIEQIASRAGASYISETDELKLEKYKNYFHNISALSSKGRVLPKIITLVSTTYLSGLQSLKINNLEEDQYLASSSSQLLGLVLKGEKFELPEFAKFGESLDLLDEIGQIELSDQIDLVDTRHDETDEESNAPMTKSKNNSAVSIENMISKVHSMLRLASEDVGLISSATHQEGPTFVSIDFEFRKGSQLAPLERREPDIARDLGVPSVEISNSDHEGKIRVLVPRGDRQFPLLNDNKNYPWDESHYLPVAIGLDLAGNAERISISSWPHALISGTTGSGKTTFVRTILSQLNSWGNAYSQIVIVDGKGETDYFGILDDRMFIEKYPEPILNVDGAVDVLTWLKDEEVPRRKKLMQELAKSSNGRVDAKSIFIEATKNNEEPLFKPLIVVIDEFNELMIRGGDSKSKFIEGVTSVAQAARSVLVHLVLATQRPDRTVVPGTIKANLPVRIAFRLPASQDSVTILGHGGAEKLLGRGDMLFQLNGEPDRRLQSYNL